VVLEKDGEDQLAHFCEKLSITEIQGREEYLTNNTKKEGYLDLSHLVLELPSKTCY
jgi:hypothetical protein